MSKANRNAHRLERGPKVYVDGNQLDRIMSGARVPPPSDEHLWVMTGMWKVDPAGALTGTAHLDTESLLLMSGPGCFHCERQYTPELAASRCRPVP